MREVEGIDGDAEPLDLVLLELPASVMTCGGSLHGSDYTAGFYEGVHLIDHKRHVALNSFQKSAYNSCTRRYPFTDIGGYKVLWRYKPKKDDGIDEVLANFFDNLRGSQNG